MFGGKSQERMAAFESELLRDVRPVIINRARVDTENFGNFFAGFVIGDEFQNSALCGG